jgi:hypothetical protein
MAHPYHHALSSVKKWGGTVDDFMAVHAWFDQSKEITADFRHRALRHHAEGIFMAVTWTGKRKGAGTLGRNRPTAALPKKLAVVGLFRVRDRISFQFLSEVGQELFDSSCDGAMTFDFARPRAGARVFGERQFQSTAFAQPRRVARRRYKARTAQVKVAFARTFRGQPQTMSQFQRSLEEVAAKPVDRAFSKISGSDHFRSCTRNHGAWFQNGLVVAQHLCVADPRIYHRHLRAFVAEDAHDGVKLCTAFCEFGSERVAESVHCHGRPASGVDQARGGTHPLQWRTKEMASAHHFSAPDEHEPDEIACPFVGQHSVCDLSAETQHNPKGLCGLIMQWDLALAGGLTDGQPKARRAIGVLVEAVHR